MNVEEQRLWLQQQNARLRKLEAERVRQAWNTLMGRPRSSSMLPRQNVLAILEDGYLARARFLQETSPLELQAWGKRCEGLAFRLMVQLHPAARAVRLTLRRDPAMRSLVRAREQFFVASGPKQQRYAWQNLSEIFASTVPVLHRYACSLDQMARGWGFAGFLDASLAARGLSRAQVEYWLTDFLANHTDVADADHPWENLRSLRVSQSPLACRNAEGETVRLTLESLGVPRDTIDAISLARYPARNGLRSPLCFAVNPPTDIRIAVRRGAGSGFGYVRALLHEFGHALYFAHATAEDLADLQESPPFAEGIAFTFEFLSLEPDWLVQHLELTTSSAGKMATDLRQSLLQDLRWVILEALFELHLFDSSSAEVYETWEQLVYRWGFAVPGVGVGCSLFAADETARPLQYLDYALGRLVGLHSVAALQGLYRDTAKAEQLRTTYFANGASVAWTEKVRAFTGRWPSHSIQLEKENALPDR